MRITALLFRRVGDSLLATPALRAIKKAYPNAELEVLVEPQVERVFRGNPWIDSIRVVQTVSSIALCRHLRRGGRPDVVVDFLSDPRSAMACFLSRSPVRVGFAHSLRRHSYTRPVTVQDEQRPLYSAQHKLGLAYAVGAKGDDEHTEFYLTDADRGWADEQWRQRGWTDDLPAVAFFVHSRRDYKRWPLAHFVEVIRHVNKQRHARPILLHTPGDDEPIRMLIDSGTVTQESIVSPRDLGCLGAALAKCSMLVGNDGGPKHIAIALNVPTLTIFGAERPEFWTPPHSDLHQYITPPDGGTIREISAISVIQRLDQLTAVMK